MTKFTGWSPAALEFFERLEADNTRAFWTANKDTYLREVKAPMEALAAEVEDEFGPLHLFRPNRDTRFSKDKSPYKTSIAARTEGEGAEGYYVALSAEQLFAGAGYYHMANDQLARYREAVDSRAGAALEKAIAEVQAKHLTVGGEALKTAPRGYPRDHPRVELLRYKGLYAGKTFVPAKWLNTKAALTRVTNTWRNTAPINRWLAKHVGPSEEIPPEDMR